jgi:exodeoxyribonuclease-3
VDALRARHPNETINTFWDYKRDRWRRNTGLRVDRILLSPQLGQRLVAAGVDREVRSKDGANDHAPVWVLLESSSPIEGKRQARSA